MIYIDLIREYILTCQQGRLILFPLLEGRLMSEKQSDNLSLMF